MKKEEIIKYLLEKDQDKNLELFKQADALRKDCVGDDVYLRAIIEFSNYCRKDCLYCGLRVENSSIERYKMSFDEIFSTAKDVVALGIKTIVLQSGEDSKYDINEFSKLIEKIKKLDLAVTLSLGELKFSKYEQLRSAGADRYLLRFETSDQKLFKKLRPGCSLESRLQCLEWLDKLGYQVGSGIMVGLPEQTVESIADDILLFKKMNLDMIGIGPFIAHENTPLVGMARVELEFVLKVLALTRIVNPYANIPATTAVGTLDSCGRQRALSCGANIVMPNATPVKYRKLYEIYPDKLSFADDAFKSKESIENMILSLGRNIGKGFGHSLVNKLK